MATTSMLVAAVGCACAVVDLGSPPGADEPGPVGQSAEALVADGTPEAVGLLGFLNSPEATFEVLDDEVPLDRRAAEGLVAHRDGPDGVLGTADDDPFDDVAEVDAVAWVGESAIGALVEHVRSLGFVPEGDDLLGVYDGVAFTVTEAEAVLALVDSASEEELDDGLGLDRRAVDSILGARPVPTVLALSELFYVGESALERLKAAAADSDDGPELGLISDLDRTVIPPCSGGLPEGAYPGVAALYDELELGDGGLPGDVHYVTARQADGIDGIDEWLESNGLPAGPISTGTSGVPWVAQAEKVRDIEEILEANPGQRFILFGDSNHVDPEVYAEVLERHPDRIAAALIHRVSTVDASELAPGLVLYDDYARAAAALLELGLLAEGAARSVMVSAQAMGLSITDPEIDGLIEESRPE